ncbi:AMP-dependent acyl-CoA synthetase [Actinomycetota bacterium]|nr:AMP-dependent acyl-CoA synthetase [Actinomycetota bacterium]
MFLELDKKDPLSIAMLNDLGEELNYGDLCTQIKAGLPKIQPRDLGILLCQNSFGTVANFLSCIENKVVLLLLPSNINSELLGFYVNHYHAAFILAPKDLGINQRYLLSNDLSFDFQLYLTEQSSPTLFDGLSMLLPTSGSTGSPKLVRHSYKNLSSIAKNVAHSFGLQPDERAMISLPVSFTQGLSTVTSNLFVGGTILLTEATLTQKAFWSLFSEQKATSITGVPYSYDVFHRLRLTSKDYPFLRILNQGGGKLTNERFMEFAQYAHDTDKRFIASYGSTETSSRMSCLPTELALQKCGSVGYPLNQGTLRVLDQDNREVQQGQVGEIVYSGPNVTLGYAENIDDLRKGDERQGVYCTGDLGYKDQDGCLFIVGRQKRFLKLFGYRIGLDETEQMIKSEFDIACACVGTDKKMIIYAVGEDKTNIVNFVCAQTKLQPSAFEVRVVGSLPQNQSGKTLYSELANQ